jgi:acetate kinase
MKIAVLNTGSGTVKSAVVETTKGGDTSLLRRETFERNEDEALEETLRRALLAIEAEEADGLAHRVVHGGADFVQAVEIDAAVEQSLEALSVMAPLHNPPALEGIRVARRILPGLPAVAVFDTAFHADRSLSSRLYALPWDLMEDLGFYRYGFHGLAHASLVESLARSEGRDPRSVNAVTLQLGSGCSACAVENGRSVETSMGFSPLEGLVMGTRSGDCDPAIALDLLRRGRSIDEVESLLNRESGLLGLGGSADVRDLLQAEARGERRAAVALNLFVRRIVLTVGAYFTLLGGRGSLVFGGGIGTHSAEIRKRVAAGLRAWDVLLDPERNAQTSSGHVGKAGFRDVYVFETEEESIIAREAAAVLG